MPDTNLQLSEYHSGDLTEACCRKVLLRHQGKFVSDMPQAMYRGLWSHHAIQCMHESGDWSTGGVTKAGIKATTRTQDQLKQEGRVLTDAVVANKREIHEEVAQCLYEYAKRFGPRFRECTLIGCELPIRLTLDGILYASHIDLLYRDPKDVWGKGAGRLIWCDYKFRDVAPTVHFLARDPQFILYELALYQGEVLLGDIWVRFGEWAACAWVHLPYLKPYARKTKATDETGEVREYLKGEARPENAICRWAPFRRDRAPDMAQELLIRPRMMNAGFFPMQPDPLGCYLCQSRDFCPRFDVARLNGEVKHE